MAHTDAPVSMTPPDHMRRNRLWERYILRGEPRDEVVPDLAAEFDVDEETIETDIATVADWLTELDLIREESGIALVAELRANRQHLHQLADRARDEDDLTKERKIREEINRSITIERQLHDASLKTTPATSELDHLLKDLD
ncbi:PqqD family protein [Natrinema soli]|uniref:PqqD family protein n=1 Tax=Natrinema soli TaxID=1930624 RepID=A0ABD5SGV4_9EURY